MIQRNKFVFTLLAAAALGSCSDDSQVKPEDNTPSTKLSEEYYTGGKLGTAFNTTSMAYEQPTPVIEEQGLDVAFKSGETFFEKKLYYRQGRIAQRIGTSVYTFIVHSLPSGIRTRETDRRTVQYQ